MKIVKKKEDWVKQFKPSVVMRGKTLHYNSSVQTRYVRNMMSLMSEVTKETKETVVQIYSSEAAKKYFTVDASISSVTRIKFNDLSNKVEKLVDSKMDEIVNSMLLDTNNVSKSTMHYSLKELSGGLIINTDFKTAGIEEAIKSSFDANVDLIKTMSSDYLGQIRGAVNRSIQKGGGLETLIPDFDRFLNKQAKQILNKAKNTALDQTRKAYTAINKARMNKIGVNKFEWLHSGGSRNPRNYHMAPFPNGLNHGIFDINDPPVIDLKTKEKGLPGQLINCHCNMRPVIVFEKGKEVVK